jgi:hypothetical protein
MASKHHAALTALGYKHDRDVKEPHQTLHIYHSEHPVPYRNTDPGIPQLRGVHKHLTGLGYIKRNAVNAAHRWARHGDQLVMGSRSGGHQITHAQPGYVMHRWTAAEQSLRV